MLFIEQKREVRLRLCSNIMNLDCIGENAATSIFFAGMLVLVQIQQ